MTSQRPTSFSKASTADDVLQGLQLKGKNVFITGANTGLGFECTRALVKVGAHVYMACRNDVKCSQAIADIIQIEGEAVKDLLHPLSLDLNSLKSVRACAKEFNELQIPLNVLMNNAGMITLPNTLTADGFEAQYGVNFLAHFLLTNLLTESLVRGTPSRVINLSSEGRKIADVDIATAGTTAIYDKAWSSYWSKFQFYGQSKSAMALINVELSRRYQAANLDIEVFGVHPGVVHTGLGRSGGRMELWVHSLISDRNLTQGAATQLYGATAPELKGKSGAFLRDSNILPLAPRFTDPKLSRALWDLAVKQSSLVETSEISTV